MAKKVRRSAALATRLNADEKRRFLSKAVAMGGTSYVLRELAIAFIEDRIVVQPPKPGALFHVETQ